MLDCTVAEGSVCTSLDVVDQSLAHIVLACLSCLGSLNLSLSFDFMSKLTLLLVVNSAVFQTSLVHRVVFHDKMLHCGIRRLAVKEALEGTDPFFVYTVKKLQASRFVFLDLLPETLDSVIVTHQLLVCRGSRKILAQDLLLTDMLETMHCSQRPSNLQRLTSLFHAPS